MQSSQALLHDAINDSLLSLGESIMKTITWHLNAQGIFLDYKTDIKINMLNDHMRQIVGNLADEVMSEVVSRLKETDPQLAKQISTGLDLSTGAAA